MPSQRKSYHWFCRYDGTYVECKDICKKVAEWIDCDKIFGMFHKGQTGENEHCHFILRLRSELQKQSFDKRFKALFIDKSSRDWSTKVWDGQLQGAGSYCFHEESELVVISKGFSEDEIEKMRKFNSEVKVKVQEAKLKGPSASIGRAVTKVIDYEMVNGFLTPQRKRKYIFEFLLWEVKAGNLHEQGDWKYKKMVEEVVILTTGVDRFQEYINDRFNSIYMS